MNKYEEVVASCNNLIYMIINRYFKGYSINDLYQVGVIGVIKAYDNYKANKGAKFSTYAYKYIYGEIYSYINKERGIKINKETLMLYKKINKAKDLLSQKLMHEPSIYELSAFLEIDKKVLEEVCQEMSPVESIDKTIYEDSKEISLIDKLKDNKDNYNINYLTLLEEIDKLSQEEKQIINLRYFQDKTQSEVASFLGLGQVEISRKEKKTLKKIKKSYQNVS